MKYVAVTMTTVFCLTLSDYLCFSSLNPTGHGDFRQSVISYLIEESLCFLLHSTFEHTAYRKMTTLLIDN